MRAWRNLRHPFFLPAFVCLSAFAQEAMTIADTPLQVMNHTAKLTGHYNGANLHLVLGFKVPHPEEEERFVQGLAEKRASGSYPFLTPEQWNERFAPSAQDEQAVVDWATASGMTVTKRYPNRLLVDIDAPVAAAEHAFSVIINNYQVNAETDYSNDRNPTLPPSISRIVQSVEGLNNIERIHFNRHR